MWTALAGARGEWWSLFNDDIFHPVGFSNRALIGGNRVKQGGIDECIFYGRRSFILFARVLFSGILSAPSQPSPGRP